MIRCVWRRVLTIKNQELIQEINNERTVRKEVKVLQKQLIIKKRSKQFVQSKYRGENKRLRERVRTGKILVTNTSASCKSRKQILNMNRPIESKTMNVI